MEETKEQNESLTQKILVDLFDKLKEDENFDESTIKKLQTLAKSENLSTQKLVEKAIKANADEELEGSKSINPQND
jgi:hypothetical protein